MKQPQTQMANMGRACLIDPTHGLSLVIGTKTPVEWCPHVAHSAPRDPKQRTPALLAKQQDWLDAKSKPDAA